MTECDNSSNSQPYSSSNSSCSDAKHTSEDTRTNDRDLVSVAATNEQSADRGRFTDSAKACRELLTINSACREETLRRTLAQSAFINANQHYLISTPFSTPSSSAGDDATDAMAVRNSAIAGKEFKNGKNERKEDLKFVSAEPVEARRHGYADPGFDPIKTPDHNEQEQPGLSVRVELPFCPSLCIRCDHDSALGHERASIDVYLLSLEREIQLLTEIYGRGCRLLQLHLGGGATNFLSEPQLIKLITVLERYFTIDEGTEASLDATAYRATYSQLALLRGLGFRELNLSFTDSNQSLDKLQSVSMLADVVSNAREVGFCTASVSLHYGQGWQEGNNLLNTAREILAFEPDRVYCTPGPNPVATRGSGLGGCYEPKASVALSLADKVARFARLVDVYCDADYEWVGLDCFARRGESVINAQRTGKLHRNNIGYTTNSNRQLVGFGINAKTDLPTISTRNFTRVSEWQYALDRDQLPVRASKPLTNGEHRRIAALSDLMCNLSVPSDEFALDSNNPDPFISTLLQDGLLQTNGDQLLVTDPGRIALNQFWSGHY
ncbi:MAG: coproporphyrinogen III oxidase [Pseudomonadota bacterium]